MFPDCQKWSFQSIVWLEHLRNFLDAFTLKASRWDCSFSYECCWSHKHQGHTVAGWLWSSIVFLQQKLSPDISIASILFLLFEHDYLLTICSTCILNMLLVCRNGEHFRASLPSRLLTKTLCRVLCVLFALEKVLLALHTSQVTANGITTAHN